MPSVSATILTGAFGSAGSKGTRIPLNVIDTCAPLRNVPVHRLDRFDDGFAGVSSHA